MQMPHLRRRLKVCVAHKAFGSLSREEIVAMEGSDIRFPHSLDATLFRQQQVAVTGQVCQQLVLAGKKNSFLVSLWSIYPKIHKKLSSR